MKTQTQREVACKERGRVWGCHKLRNSWSYQKLEEARQDPLREGSK